VEIAASERPEGRTVSGDAANGGGASSRQAGRQLLDRTFAILELFDEDRPEWTTTQAARAVGLPIPTAHRILAVLQNAGYLTRNADTKRFLLGPASLELGRRAEAALDLRRLAPPLLRRLAALTNETALLTVVNDRHDAARCWVRIESADRVPVSVEPGRELPLHAGAMQRALLAFLSADDIEAVLTGTLTALCRATITDPSTLRDKIGEVQSRGWAISFEETDEGVWGIAVPLVDGRGRAVAAVGLAAPRGRLNVSTVHRQLEALRSEASELAEKLGCRIPDLDLSTHRRLAA
jgi:IclR family acetate operon transcriptional repressor